MGSKKRRLLLSELSGDVRRSVDGDVVQCRQQVRSAVQDEGTVDEGGVVRKKVTDKNNVMSAGVWDGE